MPNIEKEIATSSVDCDTDAGRRRWQILALLVASVAINYIDRGNLSIAAPVLGKELLLSPPQMGLLLSAFFWSYASFMVLAGWLVDRYPIGLILGGGYFLWSLATLTTGFASSLPLLLALRLLLGVGESVAFPAYSRIIAETFPPQRRGLPNAMIDAGLKIGPALGALIGGLIIARFGWRILFISLGFGGMLWLIPWCLWAPRGARITKSERRHGASMLQICGRRDAWGTFLGNFCHNYAWYFLLTWLPSYLVMERHISMKLMAVLVSLPFWGSAFSSLLGGWISDRWIAHGATPTLVRKTFVVSGFLMATLMFPAVIVRDLRIAMVFLIAAYLAFGLITSNHWAITQTLAGPLASGKWTGLQNGIANLAGMVAPFATGLIVAKTGSFQLAFSSSAVILVLGAASYAFIVRDVAPLAWDR